MIEEITFLENDNGRLFIYNEPTLGTTLGVNIRNHSLSLHRQYKEIYKVLKDTLKEEGIEKVYALCETEKEQKFNETFGLQFTGMYAVCTDASVNKIMVWEIR